MKLFWAFIIVTFLISCSDDSVLEQETLFEYTQRVSNSFYITNSIEHFNIENSIGYVSISGGSDTVEIGYLLDKTVKVKNNSLSQAAFDQIVLDQNIIDDTLKCKVKSPSNSETLFKSNLMLNIPYKKSVEVKTTNGGILFSNLDSFAYGETDDGECTIYHHNGSFEAKTKSGKISGSINIPLDGFCNCYSESGDIHIQIPTNSSAIIHLKTETGTLLDKNLDLNLDTNTNTELIAQINSGESTIYIESKSGNIILEGI